LNSAISLYYYARVVRNMYLQRPIAMRFALFTCLAAVALLAPSAARAQPRPCIDACNDPMGHNPCGATFEGCRGGLCVPCIGDMDCREGVRNTRCESGRCVALSCNPVPDGGADAEAGAPDGDGGGAADADGGGQGDADTGEVAGPDTGVDIPDRPPIDVGPPLDAGNVQPGPVIRSRRDSGLDPTDDSNCSCRATPSAGTASAATLGFLLAGMLLRRRR
jgi:uncharacterized protein (TIGR03382 family)